MRALIIGITGQDGAYLSRFLLNNGYEVYGVSRQRVSETSKNINILGCSENIKLFQADATNFRSVLELIDFIRPDEIYNLAGQSSVSLSFADPIGTVESISLATLNILEAVRLIDKSIKFFNAGTGECFGDIGNSIANEATSFNPLSPYAVAKVTAYELVEDFKKNFGMFACTGILYNHESPLRSKKFVTKKVITTAARISLKLEEKLALGNIDVQRDWGWAPDYVQAMWLMLKSSSPENFIISTGHTVSLRYFVERVFSNFGLNLYDHLVLDPSLHRPSEVMCVKSSPKKILDSLGWKAQKNVDSVIDLMCMAELNQSDKSILGIS